MSATITLSNSYDLNLYIVTNRGLGVFVPANDSYDIVWEYPVEGESKGYLETFYNNTCNNVNNLLGDTYLTASYSIPSDWGTGGGGGGGGSTISVTQVKHTGEKIATILVDGAGTDLFAAQAPDLSPYVAKSTTAGLLKNDGTVDTTKYAVVSDGGDMDVPGDMNISGTLQAENLIIPVNPSEQPSTAGSIWIEINE